MIGVLFYLFLVSSHRCLDIGLFKKIQDYEEKILSSNKWEVRQVFLKHVDPICFLPLVTLLHVFLKLNIYWIPLGLGIMSG
jgi:hypothetical protein